jgi:hypothetical protein
MDPFTASMIGSSIGSGFEMFGGFLSDRKAADKADDRYEMSRDALLRQIGKTRLAYNKSGNLLQQNLAGIGKGFAGARANLSTYGNSARQSILTNQKQGLAGLATNLASRGLGGTSVMENMQRGFNSDTSRDMAAVDESIGQMFADLGLQQTAAESGARSDLANFYGIRNEAEISDRSDLISLWLNTIPQGTNPLAGAGKLGGMIGGGFFGGGGAAAGGAGGGMWGTGGYKNPGNPWYDYAKGG